MPAVGIFPSSMSLSVYYSVRPSIPERRPEVPPPTRKFSRRGACRASASASSSSSSSSVTDHNLYDLLGVDKSSNQSQIKNAYRALQKRCHPDVAGPAGHDMAIILNDAYSVLSDPNSRSAYDQEQAKFSEFEGYTGEPLYSVWRGPESEPRAVFVDEVKCVGCLKCALFASRTFAVESAYGRARVVAQWADTEDRITDAIQTCPVDCISIVQRSDLAALEFLMSKQPRGSVRMTSGNTGGARVSNIFAEIDKFQKKFHEMQQKASPSASGKDADQPADPQRETRASAVHGIKSMATWLYWQTPVSATPTTESRHSLVLIAGKPTTKKQPVNTERLREAAARRRAGEPTTTKPGQKFTGSNTCGDEYWTPALVLPPPASSKKEEPLLEANESEQERRTEEEEPSTSTLPINSKVRKENHPLESLAPAAMAVVSAMVVAYRDGDQMVEGVKQHVGGSVAMDIVNSFGMQILLAGITWYLVGAYATSLFKLLVSSKDFKR